MASNYQPTSTTGAPPRRPNESVTSPSTHPLALAPPYIQHNPEVIGLGSTTPPPPSYADSILEKIIGDAKTPPYGCSSLLPSLHYHPSPHKQDVGGLHSFGSPEESILLQVDDSPPLLHRRFLSKATTDSNLPFRRHVIHTVTMMSLVSRRPASSRRLCQAVHLVAPPSVDWEQRISVIMSVLTTTCTAGRRKTPLYPLALISRVLRQTSKG